jgi:hypothetical protein
MLSKFLLMLAMYTGQTEYTEMVYTINRPLKEVVEVLINDSPGSEKKEKFVIPDIIKEAPLLVKTEFYTKQGYYKVDISLLEPYNRVCSADKSLEVWSKRDTGQTLVRSRIQLHLRDSRMRIVDRLKEWIIDKIECKILEAEYGFIKNLENR